MSSDLDFPSATLRVMYHLDQATKRLPIDQLLSELHIVVERITFTALHENKIQSSNEFINELNLLFENEISAELLKFVHWLATMNALGVMSGRTGNLFLQYCIKQYRNVPEIHFTTPVELQIETQEYITERLYRLYPSSSRVVYRVMPNLVAGFVIYDGTKTIDRSLQSHMTRKIKSHIIEDIRHGRSYRG